MKNQTNRQKHRHVGLGEKQLAKRFFEALKRLLRVVSLEGNSTCSRVTKKQVEMASKEGEKCRAKEEGEHSTRLLKGL